MGDGSSWMAVKDLRVQEVCVEQFQKDMPVPGYEEKSEIFNSIFDKEPIKSLQGRSDVVYRRSSGDDTLQFGPFGVYEENREVDLPGCNVNIRTM